MNTLSLIRDDWRLLGLEEGAHIRESGYSLYRTHVV